jgi:hypothetical protein
MRAMKSRGRRAKSRAEKAARARGRRPVLSEVYSQEEFHFTFAALGVLSEIWRDSCHPGQLTGVLDSCGGGLIRYKPGSARERAECVATVEQAHATYSSAGSQLCVDCARRSLEDWSDQ